MQPCRISDCTVMCLKRVPLRVHEACPFPQACLVREWRARGMGAHMMMTQVQQEQNDHVPKCRHQVIHQGRRISVQMRRVGWLFRTTRCGAW